MRESIFWINKKMVGYKNFAKVASEQDCFAYYIARLDLDLSMNIFWKKPEPKVYSWLEKEIAKWYNWSNREFIICRPTLRALLKNKEVVKQWLLRVGAPEEVWKELKIEMPVLKVKKIRKGIEGKQLQLF
jgi:hypothetical protein